MMTHNDRQAHQKSLRGTSLLVRTERFDPRAVLSSALAPLEIEAADREIAIDLHFAANVPDEVHADRGKLVWATTVLAGNALRYLSRARMHARSGVVGIAVGYDESELAIVVEIVDNGPGLPPHVADIVSRDGDASEVAPQLQVLRDVVAALGGRVDLASARAERDSGTRLRIRFPTGERRPPDAT